MREKEGIKAFYGKKYKSGHENGEDELELPWWRVKLGA